MWKDNLFGKRIKYYTKFNVYGRNISTFLNILYLNKIEVYKVKKIDEKSFCLSIKSVQIEKFFAITKELCYTIKEVKSYGIGYHFLRAINNFGLMIGVVAIFIVCYLSNNIILSIDYIGTGNIYQTQIEKQLVESGLNIFSFFPTSERINEIENSLLKNDNILFITLQKSGNHLIVNAIKNSEKPKVLEKNKDSIVSLDEGIIEDIRVYSGFSNFNVGDNVKVGDVLIKSEKVVKEQVVCEDIIASITMICKKEIVFDLKVDNDDVALLFAMEEFDGEVVSFDLSKAIESDKTKYNISLFYRVKYTVE